MIENTILFGMIALLFVYAAYAEYQFQKAMKKHQDFQSDPDT